MSRSARFLAACAAAIALMALAEPARAQQTNNHVLRAVPAPGAVAVDGRLGDWDLSGQILICYDSAHLADTHSVRVAAMYDRDGLYLAFQFKDRTPLVNHIDPVNDPAGGWKSDAVQIRMKADIVAHVTAWFYTDRQQPAMSIHYGLWDRKAPDFRELDNALAAGAKEAFQRDADGKGYCQEIALPWELVTRDGHALRAGESLVMGLEVFWGEPRGMGYPEHRYADLVNPQRQQREFFWTTPDAWGTVHLLDHGKLDPSPSVEQLSDVERLAQLRYSTQGPVAIEYQTPQDGGVTLVIEKPDGTRVKNLVSDYPRKAGPNTDRWDGTDDAGHLAEPGEYRVRGLSHAGLDVLYEFAYGNPGNPPYDNSKGTGGWLSNHDNPFAVTADDERIYVAAPQAEGATSLLCIDYNGQRQWGIANISAGLMAREGPYLYMLVGGYIYQPFVPEGEVHVVRLDPKSGKYAPFPDNKNSHAIATVPASLLDWPGFKARRPEGELVASHGFDADWCQRQTMGLAAAGGKLYASLYYQNQIVVVDPAEGKPLGQIPIERPAGLAADKAGSLYAISGKRILRLGAGQQWTPVVAQGLSAPIGLACDAQGNLYVSDWADQMCVKVFSPTGQLLRTIGRVGGRPLAGRYDPGGMFRPFGVAVDGQNRLWVAECDISPRRVSVWDAAGGRFLREFCGTTWYSAMGARVNARDPRQAFVLGNTCELDWPRGLWRVTGTLWRPTRPEALFGLNTEGLIMDAVRVRRRTLLVASSNFLFCVAELGDYDAKPLAAMGWVYCLYHVGSLWPDLVVRHLAKDPQHLAALQKKHPTAFTGLGRSYPDVSSMLNEPDVRSYFLWCDQNGDGLVQEPEIQFFSKEELGGMRLQSQGWHFAFGPDLTVYLPGTSDEGGPRQQLWRLPVQKWNRAGAPVYDLKDAKLIANVPVLTYPDSSMWTDRQGQTLIGQNPMMMLSPEGKLLWTYPNPWGGVHGSHTAPAAQRGRIIGPLYVLGSAEMGHGVGEVFCLSGNLGERYFVTTDGLYVASVFQDCRSAPDALPDEPRRGMSIDGSTAGGESFGGEFFQNPRDRKLYLGGPVGSCREASIIAQVTGLESVRRLPTQSLAFTPQQHAEAEGLLARRAVEQAAGKVLAIAKARQAVKDVPDFAVFDLSDRRLARWNFDARHAASATWAYDQTHLYLAFREVMDDTPMINGGADPRTLFKTGDAVAFELRTKPDDDSPHVIEGDLRLLISVLNNKPVAVLYRYKVPGTAHPVEFTSPVGTTRIDQVVTLDNARIAIDRHAGGYHLRAAIPLADLGFAPQKERRYRGDFGVIYSDKAGKIDELRMYWANPANAMVNDLFSESQINPAAWGRFQVEE